MNKLLESGRPRSLIVHDALVGYYLLGPAGTTLHNISIISGAAPTRHEVSVHTIDQIIISVVVITLGLAI